MSAWLRGGAGLWLVCAATGCSLVLDDAPYRIGAAAQGQAGVGEQVTGLPAQGVQGGTGGRGAGTGGQANGGSGGVAVSPMGSAGTSVGGGVGGMGSGGTSAAGSSALGLSDAGLDAGSSAADNDADVLCSVVEGAVPECCELQCVGSDCKAVPREAGATSPAENESSCLRRVCDGAGGVQIEPDHGRCDDGVFCNGEESCSFEGVCVSGVVPCPGSDTGPQCLDSCNEQARSCERADNEGVVCDFGIGPGVCDGSGVCVECRDAADCSDEDRPSCGEDGRCVQCLENGDCGGLTPVCNEGGVCSCTSDDDCASEGVCSRGVCGADGVCEQEPLAAGVECGAGEAPCSGTDRCDGNGTCLLNHRAAGTPATAPPGDCRSHECDGVGGVRPVAGDDAVNNARCDDDNFCTGDEICTAQGACQSLGNPCGAGRPFCVGNSCLQCTSDEHCSSSAPFCVGGDCVQCETAADCGEPTVCSRFVCATGQCQPTFLPAGERCGEEPRECSDQDTCDGAGVCLPNHRPIGETCDDGRFCTLGDRCIVGGVCRFREERVCTVGGGNVCSESLQRCVQCTEDRHCDGFCGPDRPGSCDLQGNGCRC